MPPSCAVPLQRGCNADCNSVREPSARHRHQHREWDEMAVDQDKLMEFLGRFVGDLGRHDGRRERRRRRPARPLPGAGAGKAQTAQELADATGTDPRYVEEWLRGQAAGGYVGYDAAGGTYSLTEEQAFALTDPDGPVFMPGAFELALGSLQGRAADHRGGPHRRGRRLARARQRRVHRLRAVLPARLPGEPDAVVAAGAGRRRGEAAGGRDASPTSAAGTARRRC